ncbi:hypothetical protein [Pectinatus brassicae]|uniref:Uncharacterized protein n=1 Tax=Pectinatus brassicae TaxID=862415 RepID=A0A840UYW2_9FIRM|nr:hypothetical protein [Pectinatus brassicae]MBB5337555.1 hypothetical protein [Pectinatus brassicae]
MLAIGFFAIKRCFFSSLDIVLTDRTVSIANQKIRKPFWTQGKFYNFDEGYVFYDNKAAYELSWGDALKQFKYTLLIKEVVPTINKDIIIYDKDKIVRKSLINYGSIKFILSSPTEDKQSIQSIGMYDCKQDDFVHFLKTGVLNSIDTLDLRGDFIQ